jgi:DNA-binding NarL/FixJ family response regulator
MLLVFCEDAKALREIEDTASKLYRIEATRSPDRVTNLARTNPTVAVLMVEQTTTHGSSIELLKLIQFIRPSIRRVLLANPDQLAEIIEGLHCGALERIVYKPIREDDLLAAIAIAPVQVKRATA